MAAGARFLWVAGRQDKGELGSWEGGRCSESSPNLTPEEMRSPSKVAMEDRGTDPLRPASALSDVHVYMGVGVGGDRGKCP